MIERPDSNSEQWFAVRVKSRHEKAVALMAARRGFEEFVPVYHCRRRWSDRAKTVEFPLFPGYIFCHLHVERRLPLLTIPGVLHFVGAGKSPAPVDESEIAAIQGAVRSGLSIEPWPFLENGQRVRLEDGPLVGMEGIFVKDAGQGRIVASITLLQRAVAVAVERHWVKPVDSRSPISAPEVGTNDSATSEIVSLC
jgi:transcription antitermination factor NusG